MGRRAKMRWFGVISASRENLSSSSLLMRPRLPRRALPIYWASATRFVSFSTSRFNDFATDARSIFQSTKPVARDKREPAKMAALSASSSSDKALRKYVICSFDMADPSLGTEMRCPIPDVSWAGACCEGVVGRLSNKSWNSTNGFRTRVRCAADAGGASESPLVDSRQRGAELLLDATTHVRTGRVGIRARVRPSPDGRRPGRIRAEAGNYMDVQLRHQVAECREVELVGPKRLRNRPGYQGDLLDQRQPVGFRQLEDLAGAFPLRHQDEPRIRRVVHQQQLAQAETTEADGVSSEAGMQVEHDGIYLCAAAPIVSDHPRRARSPVRPPREPQAAAAAATPSMIRPPSPAVMRTRSPSLIRPSRIMLPSGFCSSRWITRFSGRAP